MKEEVESKPASNGTGNEGAKKTPVPQLNTQSHRLTCLDPIESGQSHSVNKC